MIEAEFKLLRVVDGACHFAQVRVAAEIRRAGIEVGEDLPASVSIDDGEVNRGNGTDWVDAAIHGIRQCLSFLVEGGQLPGGKVSVTRVRGTTVDTTAEDVRCAAFLAAWRALAPAADTPEHTYQKGAWQIAPKAVR